MFSSLGVGTLNGKVQANQRLARAGHARHEADRLAVMGLAVLDDSVDLIGRDRQVLRTGVTSCDVMDIVTTVKGLCRFHNRRRWEILRILPCLIVEIQFTVPIIWMTCPMFIALQDSGAIIRSRSWIMSEMAGARVETMIGTSNLSWLSFWKLRRSRA